MLIWPALTRLWQKTGSVKMGLAWSPNGEEIWFTATHEGLGRALYAVDLSGKERLLARVPGTLTLLDIARDGRVLLKRDANRQEIKAYIDGASQPRELSWFDFSLPSDLSRGREDSIIRRGGRSGGCHLRNLHSRDRRLTCRAARRRKPARLFAGRQLGAGNHSRHTGAAIFVTDQGRRATRDNE